MSQISADDGGTGIQEHYLTPGEVAALYRVDPKTVTRWAASGRLEHIRTPGGHRRFAESAIRNMLRAASHPGAESGAVPDHPAISPVEVR